MRLDIVIKEITESDFNTSSKPLLFKSGYLDRRFALVGNNAVFSFLIGWQSDLLSPRVFTITHCDMAIGIDLSFAIVDFCENKVLMKLELPFNFIDLIQIGNKLVIVTELEIIEVEEYSVVNNYFLSDVYEELSVVNGVMNVKCVNGDMLEWKF
ncbi:hypothetical protein [Chitinophaga nivalis]|uniref:Uncharacterized protein n=1 Tax=Chitinophaga nivalis TaxID=2991709 RepID=A0ABT3ISE7_9BACT|nr:hypothetical protein [Chitinophaga nivalis]MCW3463686.1 hypothetical protein [Chitinophaga nivalis]MCW3486624.1 hypothetical protein [Chitinophaga nivalis]